MDLLTHTSLLVALMSFAFGVALVSRNFRNKVFLAYGVLCLAVCLWAGSFSLYELLDSRALYRIHLFVNIWLGPIGLIFLRQMIRLKDPLSERLLRYSFVGSVLLSGALIAGWVSQPLILQFTYFAPATMLLQTARLILIDHAVKKGKRPVPKIPVVGLGSSKRLLIYIGGLLVLLTSVMDHVPFMGRVVPAFGNLALTVYLFFLSEAISQHRFLNFGGLFSRFLVLIAVALMLTGIYALLFAWMPNRPGLFFLNSFIVSFVVLMLLDPIKTMVSYLTGRLVNKDERGLAVLFSNSLERLTGIVNLQGFYRELADTTQIALGPRSIYLYTLNFDGTRYHMVHRTGDDDFDEVMVDHPLLQRVRRYHEVGDLPILLDQVIENEIDRSASRNEQDNLRALLTSLRALGGNLLIPLIDSSKVLGFFVLDVPEPPPQWGANWGMVRVVYPYYRQTARTLRGMEVYVRQREKERLATLGEMSAGLAHEIRNPLGAIKGAAQFLDPNSGKPEARFLKIIVDEVDRLDHVVRQFLDYSKPPVRDQEQFDLRELVCRIIEAIRPSVPTGTELLLVGEGQFLIRASRHQIHQLVVNLLQNGIWATRDTKGGRVLVRLEHKKSGQVCVSVEDNGPGIQEELVEKIFVPFYTTSDQGTGLGLSICQKIADAHRAALDVSSVPGSATRFSLKFPPPEASV